MGDHEERRALEAAIERAPSDVRPYLVYGDWLQARGDPRGQLIAVMVAMAIVEGDLGIEATGVPAPRLSAHRLAAERDRLLRDHKAAFVGSWGDLVDTLWHLGFVSSVSLLPTPTQPLEAELRELLAHPSGRFVRSISIESGRPDDRQGRYDPDYETQLVDVSRLADIIAEGAPATLRELEFGRLRFRGVQRLGDGLEAIPQLRELFVRGHSDGKLPRRADALEIMTLAPLDDGGPWWELLASAEWPCLASLTLHLANGFDVGWLARDAAARYPALESLSIFDSNAEPPELDGLVAALVQGGVAARLTRLELGASLGSSLCQALIDQRERFAVLAKLDLTRSRLPSDMRQRLVHRFGAQRVAGGQAL